MTDFYESDGAIAEYLLFHYGQREEILPYEFGPAEALGYPARCVTECLAAKGLPARARALDLGCAVGRASFELARYCPRVLGIDASRRFIEVAQTLQAHGHFEFEYPVEGRLTRSTAARVPADIERERVSFQTGNAEDLPEDLGTFDVVLMANLIDRLPEPRRCLARLSALTNPGGQLILTSPYTWLEDYTSPANWLGGIERAGVPVRTAETLAGELSPCFELIKRKDLPFLIREHERKYQWSVAEATVWRRR